jgi:hypothetical protein
MHILLARIILVPAPEVLTRQPPQVRMNGEMDTLCGIAWIAGRGADSVG